MIHSLVRLMFGTVTGQQLHAGRYLFCLNIAGRGRDGFIRNKFTVLPSVVLYLVSTLACEGCRMAISS